MKKMDEAQLVEIGDGIVMANMRNQHLQVGMFSSVDLQGNTRAVSISLDGGENFGPIYYDPALIDPVCAASIIRDYSSSNKENPHEREEEQRLGKNMGSHTVSIRRSFGLFGHDRFGLGPVHRLDMGDQ